MSTVPVLKDLLYSLATMTSIHCNIIINILVTMNQFQQVQGRLGDKTIGQHTRVAKYRILVKDDWATLDMGRTTG